MSTSSLSKSAQEVLEGYDHFRIDPATCSVPYFNNKKIGRRFSLRAYIGKGSPAEIREEVSSLFIKDKIDIGTLNSSGLKKFLINNNLGIECSGFVYHVLDAENRSRGLGPLGKKIRLVNLGFLSRIFRTFRPAENCDVTTFASDRNSLIVPPSKIKAGDMITMITSKEKGLTNHILLITGVNENNEGKIVAEYAHAAAYPEDGLEGTGIKKGTIEIAISNQNLADCLWIENGAENQTNRIYRRALASKTELRRLRWFEPEKVS